MSKVPEVKRNTAVGAAIDYSADAGSGFENADAAAYAIPFLSILQSGSPQVKKSDGAYIKGAEEGMLYNSVTQQVFDGAAGLFVVPCYFKRSFLKWADRTAGGGFRGELMPSDPQVGAAKVGSDGRMLHEDGDNLSDTRTHYVLMVVDGAVSPAVISFSSTQIKKSRNWMAKMDGVKMKRPDGSLYTPAMFSHVYKVSTTPESNDKGSWFGWKIELMEPNGDAALYEAAKNFRTAVGRGELKEQVPQQEDTTTEKF